MAASGARLVATTRKPAAADSKSFAISAAVRVCGQELLHRGKVAIPADEARHGCGPVSPAPGAGDSHRRPLVGSRHPSGDLASRREAQAVHDLLDVPLNRPFGKEETLS